MRKSFLTAILLAWLIFIMIDFLFHASILAPFWLKQHPALRSLEDLALLIPAGYLSFLLLTILVGWLYTRLFPSFPGWGAVFRFGMVFSAIFSTANFLGMYSYLSLPAGSILLINLVYFLELWAVPLVFAYLQKEGIRRQQVLRLLLLFIGGLIAGVVIQNFFGHYH